MRKQETILDMARIVFPFVGIFGLHALALCILVIPLCGIGSHRSSVVSVIASAMCTAYPSIGKDFQPLELEYSNADGYRIVIRS
jgi:hypothetical protein